VRDIFGLELTHIRKCAIAGPIAWSGPGRAWLAMGDETVRVRTASTCRIGRPCLGQRPIRCSHDHSVSGERARCPGEGVPIDLHPVHFVQAMQRSRPSPIWRAFWQVAERPPTSSSSPAVSPPRSGSG
jgi:hypothetical protein